MNMTRKFAIAGAGILSLIGVGAATAVAQGNPPIKAPAVSAAATTLPAMPTVGNPDTPQQGGQIVATRVPSRPTETVDSESETPGTEDQGGTGVAGAGHADPPGQTVDHQFQGVE